MDSFHESKIDSHSISNNGVFSHQKVHLIRDGNPWMWQTMSCSIQAQLMEDLRRPIKQNMLYTIAVILIILWLLGLVTSYTLGGFIHILLVIAIIMVIVNLVSGRRL